MKKLIDEYESAYTNINNVIIGLEERLRNSELEREELRKARRRLELLRTEKYELNSTIREMYRYLAPKPATPSRAAAIKGSACL